MDTDTRDEFLRLESKVDRNEQKIDKVYDEVHDMRVKQKGYEIEAVNTRKDISELNVNVVALTNTLNKLNGNIEGATAVKKWAWTLGGSILVASILAAATTIVDLQKKVAVLESARHLNGD